MTTTTTIIIALALAIAFFLKGNKVNNILAIVIAIIGMIAFCADGWGFRLVFSVLAVVSSTSEEIVKKPCSYKVIAMTFVLLCLVKFVTTDLFGWYPGWTFTIIALGGSVVYVLNVSEDK